MFWKRWFLTGCVLGCAGLVIAQPGPPAALLTLHSPHSAPSLQEQSWLIELQRLLQRRYTLWVTAETPALKRFTAETKVAFGLRLQEETSRLRLELTRTAPEAFGQQSVAFCSLPCGAIQQTETLRTLLAFVEPEASALWVAELPPVPELHEISKIEIARTAPATRVEARKTSPQKSSSTAEASRAVSKEATPTLSNPQKLEERLLGSATRLLKSAQDSIAKATLSEKPASPRQTQPNRASIPETATKNIPEESKLAQPSSRQPSESAPKTPAGTEATPTIAETKPKETDSAIHTTATDRIQTESSEEAANQNLAALSVGPSGNSDQLEQFRRQLAERTYNRQIWQEMRNQLMFFRQENRKLPKPAPLRVRLKINPEGKVVGQELLDTSNVPAFDALVLRAAPLLELEPPDASLVREPPYVVVLRIAP